jgi:hypothetical protein
MRSTNSFTRASPWLSKREHRFAKLGAQQWILSYLNFSETRWIAPSAFQTS